MSIPHPSVLPSLDPIAMVTMGVWLFNVGIPRGPQSPMGQPSSGGLVRGDASCSGQSHLSLAVTCPVGSLNHISLVPRSCGSPAVPKLSFMPPHLEETWGFPPMVHSSHTFSAALARSLS